MDDYQIINRNYFILEVIFYHNNYLMKKINTQLYVEQVLSDCTINVNGGLYEVCTPLI